MNIEIIEKIAEENMKNMVTHEDREKGWCLAHGRRTAKLAVNLRKKIFPGSTYNDEIIYVAGLFHDIGKQHPDHEKAGAIITRNLIDEYCTADEMDEICEIIENHNAYDTDKESRTWNLMLVQDADIIDHQGAVFIWLTMHMAAEKGIGVDDCLKMFEKYDTPDNILRNGGLLNFEESKKIITDRYDMERAFFDRLRQEQNGIF